MKTEKTISTFFPPREGTRAAVPNWILYFNGTYMEVDEQRLPPRLVRLLPRPLCTAEGKDFLPFATVATALKLMKPLGR